MVTLRSHRWTYAQIGQLLGISRQRVHQVLKNYTQVDPHLLARVRAIQGHACVICDSHEHLEVHHIDGQRTNNAIENLATLCRSCHYRIESKDRKTRDTEVRYFPKRVPYETRTCARTGCQERFSVNKNLSKKFCSKVCATLASRGPNYEQYAPQRRWNNAHPERHRKTSRVMHKLDKAA
jgi:5-methylcytosine-specific restriction endonuclease McrA